MQDGLNIADPRDWIDFDACYQAVKDHAGQPARCLWSIFGDYQMSGIYVLTDELIEAVKNKQILFDLEL
jgi:hypothetical protein